MSGYTISANGKATILKDPSAVLDYTLDWTDWLAGAADSLATLTVSATNGCVVDRVQISINLTTAWISGGTVGTTSVVTFHITTFDGRADDRSIYVKIRER